ncbi:hypothetical protein [Caldithrix abyssi]|uniref:Uncharacterized protein n=1 Tax=Caldithrix abyssi DSM 13497 TaxID=880073 RepID=H1XWP9_CALAY|nr:hypothetical protein [Caldithrix abyssi]APF19090.1 hypothetical protein Cabys_2341 [Caldithrix abyssi DSM 13497]EHO43025.1 hypothetical protein Calab_3425 [Caldithrix abyssi DSM 13497]
MTTHTKTQWIYLILVAITFVGGYLFLRSAYLISSDFPFTQEIILVFLGTIATIVITALLLNKQTEVELKKEENIKYIELKTNFYVQFLDYVEEMLSKPTISEKDFMRLRALTHKLSLVSSERFLEQYRNFLNVFLKSSEDKHFSEMDIDEISSELARLCLEIRHDLLSESGTQKIPLTQRVSKVILNNTRVLKRKPK